MFDPETAELWWTCNRRCAEPLMAQVNLPLKNGRVFVFGRLRIKDSTCDNLQLPIVVGDDGMGHWIYCGKVEQGKKLPAILFHHTDLVMPIRGY